MTNDYLQSRLDKMEYRASEEALQDMSGSMYYCDYCDHKNYTKCDVNHADRIKHNYCATAYNRYHRILSKKRASKG